MATHRERLEALRDLLWDSMLEAPADKRGALAAQHLATLDRLAALADTDAAPKGTGLDEFNAFKQQREAEAASRAGKASS